MVFFALCLLFVSYFPVLFIFYFVIDTDVMIFIVLRYTSALSTRGERRK